MTLALAFATRRMTQQNLLVRVLGACETMANATVVRRFPLFIVLLNIRFTRGLGRAQICTDKTGTLTQNKMSVVAGAIGVHLKFADRLAENASRTNANDDSDPEKAAEDDEKDKAVSLKASSHRAGRLDFSCDMKALNVHLSSALQRLLNSSIAINSTAFEGTDEHGQLGGFVGSKTETALLSFAKDEGWADYKKVRQDAQIVQMIPFSSERKAMGVVVRLPAGGYRLLVKGASEVLAKISNRHVVVSEIVQETSEQAMSDEILTEEFTDETRSNICASSRPLSSPPQDSTDAQLVCYQPERLSSTRTRACARSRSARATLLAGPQSAPKRRTAATSSGTTSLETSLSSPSPQSRTPCARASQRPSRPASPPACRSRCALGALYFSPFSLGDSGC